MKIGFIAGVFDGCHDGHKFILSEAMKHCDKLHIALNWDEYIRDKKNREPLNNWSKRYDDLAETGLVSGIFGFYANPIDLILWIKPDVIFCGSDYKKEDVIGYGLAEIIIIDRIPGISTTELLKQNKI